MPLSLGCGVVIHLCSCGCGAQERAGNCEEEKLAGVFMMITHFQ
jgi:hypothetical protein